VSGTETGELVLAVVQIQVGWAVSVPMPPTHENELNVAVASELYTASELNVALPPALDATKTSMKQYPVAVVADVPMVVTVPARVPLAMLT